MFDQTKVKFNEVVRYHHPCLHSQSGVIVKRDFYDRCRDINAVLQQLVNSATKVIVVVGERRSGKTSFVKHIGTILANSAENSRFVEIPWGGIQSWEELAREILEAISTGIGRPLEASTMNVEAPVGNLQTPRDFITALNQLLATAAATQIVVAIDEFDSILDSSPDADQLIGLASAFVEEFFPRIRLLLTMARIPCLLAGTPLLQLSSPVVQLRPFPKADMDQMILEIVEDQHPIPTGDLQAIYELSGGWPYFAKLILHGMADLVPGPDQVNQAMWAAINDESASYVIDNIYSIHFDDAEKKLVLLLAEGHGYITAVAMTSWDSATQVAVQRLAERNYVQLETNGDCSFRVKLLAPWFRNWFRYDLELGQYLGDLPQRGE